MVIKPGDGSSAIGLIPANDPPFTITPTDYYMIVTEFLTAAGTPVTSGPEKGQCAFGFSQEQMARMNFMLYELAGQVVNDPNRGLTHGDPLGPNTCLMLDPPFNVLTACGGP